MGKKTPGAAKTGTVRMDDDLRARVKSVAGGLKISSQALVEEAVLEWADTRKIDLKWHRPKAAKRGA